MQLRRTLLVLFVLSLTLTEGQNTSCGNDFKALEKALLETGNNTLKLLQAFYPPRQPPATFVTVHYTFLDAEGNIACQKTWLWSLVEFYLIQPPSIFMYTSLFFTILQDRITTANITFKDECRELMTWNENSSCTCTSDGMLDILTQRLKFYAKVNNPDDINIDDNSLAAAVCEDEQKKKYDGTAVKLFFICGLFIPFSAIILLVMIIWSSRSRIGPFINKEQNHANLAALALTGLVFSTFVVLLDSVALRLAVEGKHEFPTHSNLYSLTFAMITTAWDALAVLVAYMALLALCLKQQVVWLVTLMCFVPLFCIASHSGYIIVAWLSDTQHGGPATFFYIISFSYYFIIFRQTYKFYNRKRHQEAEEIPQSSTNGHTAAGTNTTNTEERQPETQPPIFNLLVFFMEILLGVILVGAEVFVIYSFTILPVTITAVPTVGSLASLPGRTRSGNEANIIQLAFIIITGFFTYKFLYTDDEPKQFMKAFVNYLKKKGLEGLDLTGKDAEAAGKAVGKVAYTIIEQNRETNRKNVSTNTHDTDTHKHAQTRTDTHKHAQTCTDTHKHAQTRTDTHKHTQTCSKGPVTLV